MNKGGVGGVGGGGSGSSGGGSGPTAAAAAAAAQKQKTLLQRVEADIGSIVDNFTHLVNVSRVNDLPVRNSQEAFMMEMRAARMLLNTNIFKTLYLSWYQSLSKPQSSLDLHPLMTMWSKEQLSLINRQRRQTTCWQELERRQLPASRSLNCTIFLQQRGLVILRSCEWVA